MFFTLATAFAAALSVSAQTTHTVTVGLNGTLTYTPANITAAKGDIVSFVFATGNHSVTQSTFAQPCTQLTNTTVTPNVVGISSGFVKAPPSGDLPTWSFAVSDTATPLWFFCLQGKHCQQGMVFSINATPEKSHDAYVQAAKSSNASIPNPETQGAATNPSQNGTNSAPGINNPTSSTTPNGTPAGQSGSPSQTSGSSSGAAPSQSSGAAIPNVQVPSLALGALALVFGVSL